MMRREPYLLHRKGDVHYIGGAEVLPPPLPSEQENQVIGDLGTEYEDEAKAILIEHNLRLVVYIAKKFDNTGVGVEDLISIGTIGLIKSINTFNPEKNIKPYNDDEKKSVQVEKMFDNIAPAYDQLNHALSWNIDKSWRRKAINWLKPFHPQRMMDVATGTGDFAIQACRILQPEELIGTDISEGMMNVGREKVKAAGLESRISFAKEDCTALTFPDKRFDAITVAFGVRNFEDLDKGLREIHRVLDDNGKLVILELSEPDWFPMKQLYAIYSKVVIPTLGKLLSKDQSAYTYLPQSIKAFPQGEIMTDIIRKAGFSQVNFKRLTLGICTLYLATK